LATTSEGENIANITGMQFETVLNDNEDCASLASIQKVISFAHHSFFEAFKPGILL
jgi:hypothetical protein